MKGTSRDAPRVTLAQVCEAHRDKHVDVLATATMALYERYGYPTVTMLGRTEADITTESFQSWISGLNGTPARNRNRRIALAKQVFTWACSINVGLMTSNPFSGVLYERDTEPLEQGRGFTMEELTAVLRTQNARWNLITLLYLETGARRNELRLARWADVDLAERLIRFPAERTKMRRPHMNYLGNYLTTLLTAEKTVRMAGLDDAVIPTMFPRPGCMGFMSETAVRGELQKQARAAGVDVPRLGAHTLRKTTISLLYHLGIRKLTIKALVGHGDVKSGDLDDTTYIYVQEPELRSAVDKLEQLFVGLLKKARWTNQESAA